MCRPRNLWQIRILRSGRSNGFLSCLHGGNVNGMTLSAASGSIQILSWQFRAYFPSLRTANVSPLIRSPSNARPSLFVSHSPSLNPDHFGMHQRRSNTTKTRKETPPLNGNGSLHDSKHELNGSHDHDHHDHSHSHSLFGHSHDEEHGQDAERILAALKGSGDRGSQITLLGLFSNVALTATKGLAGWYMHSASLLADAGHSLSDLLGDFVTLFCWHFSRKPPSERYPYGFAKFETLGTTTISILLIGGAIGIGVHSYHLLIAALSETALNLNPGPMHDFLLYVTSSAPLPKLGHAHVHAVDPNAAWFAAIGVLLKEYLYRVTKVVADEEKSPVLMANAIHHRSDAYSCLVAFFAIIGTWLFPAFPLDPIGGLLVSAVILQQGYSLFRGAWGDLTDASVSPRTRRSLQKVLDPLILRPSAFPQKATDILPSSLLSVHGLRARRSGSLIYIDLTAGVSSDLTVAETSALEEKITQVLKDARKEVAEVRVRFQPEDVRQS